MTDETDDAQKDQSDESGSATYEIVDAREPHNIGEGIRFWLECEVAKALQPHLEKFTDEVLIPHAQKVGVRFLGFVKTKSGLITALKRVVRTKKSISLKQEFVCIVSMCSGLENRKT